MPPRLLTLAVLGFVAAPLFAAAPRPVPLRTRVDQLISARKDFATHKAARSSDAEFVRRVYLDLTGTIPSVAQTRAFIADKSTNKREALVDQLLKSPEHA